MRWMVTGGAGFIGSCFVRRALADHWADEVVVVDALTYAGNIPIRARAWRRTSRASGRTSPSWTTSPSPIL